MDGSTKSGRSKNVKVDGLIIFKSDSGWSKNLKMDVPFESFRPSSLKHEAGILLQDSKLVFIMNTVHLLPP